MNRLFAVAGLAITLFVSSASQAAPPSGEAQVRAELTRCLQAFTQGDADTFTGCFASDITLFNPDIPGADTHRLEGRDAVAGHFRHMIEDARQHRAKPPYFDVQPRNIAVQMLGDVAVATFEFDRDNGSFGRRTFVFAHRDAHWWVVHIHASNTAEHGSVH